MTDTRTDAQRLVKVLVIANKTGYNGIYREIEVDLDDPELDPAAMVLAQCLDRDGQIDACARSVLTKREIADQLPADRRDLLLEKSRLFSVDLDCYDEIQVQPTIRMLTGESHSGRTQTPASFLNRIAVEYIPDGYYPVGAWPSRGEAVEPVEGVDIARAFVHYLSLTHIARRKNMVLPRLLARDDLPPADLQIGTARGWLPETIDAWDTNQPAPSPADDPAPF